MRRKKGFTLIEMIIVLVIIGILAGILIPSWGYYLQRSKIKAQNNKAKIIFNAAQTVVTEMQMSERKIINDYNDGDTSSRPDILTKMYTHAPGFSNEWYFYYDGKTGKRVDADGKAINKNNDDINGNSLGYTDKYVTAVGKSEWNDKLIRDINKILDENGTVYKIYVKDYKVQSVVAARFKNDQYIGAYPTNYDKLDEKGKDIDALRALHVEKQTMTYFDIDTSDL